MPVSDEDWAVIHRKVTQAGLLPAKSVRERLLELPDIDLLIDAAKSIGKKGMLDAATLDALLGEMKPIQRPVKEENVVARTIAPVSAPEPSPAPRMHELDDYRLVDFPMKAKDIDAEISIHFDITGKSVTEGRKEDIRSCFNDRLKQIRRLILDGGLPNRPMKVNELLRRKRSISSVDEMATVIGIVSDSKNTKGGHLRFTIEDDSGSVDCMLGLWNEDDACSDIVHSGLMDDDVIGVTGHFPQGRDDLRVDDIHFPPLKMHNRNTAGEDRAVSVAFISDLHLGSKTFLEPQWHKMIEWFNKDPLAETIRYLVISGDGVDGVGIYPGQERELNIPDLFNQYSTLGTMLQGLPEWVDVLLLPGNHDAVRPAEPQPALDPELQTDYNNTLFVGNPCDFSLHGVRVLSYHGVSIMDFVSSLRTVTFERPEAAMKAMIDRRHLAPSWGGKTPLSPEPEDRLVIQEIPDIFVTGHVHGHHTESYKGVTLVHSSTWQDQTSYQRMLGFQPKPCILTVVNLHTHATAAIPFV
jgi:DNA polymerase II small subunit